MSTLEKKVKTWVETQGYPLEMRVAEILRKADVNADPYRVYEDTTTGKTREIDIVGYFDNPTISVHLVVECKHARDKPWLLFCTTHRALTPKAYVESVPCTPKARAALKRVSKSSRVQHMKLFEVMPLVGFRLVRVHTDNQDAAHHAVIGLGSACASTAAAIGRYGHSVIYPPVIVIDAPLLQCHLPDEGSDLEITEVPSGLLLHRAEHHTPIHVVHIDSFTEFIETILRETSELASIVLRSS